MRLALILLALAQGPERHSVAVDFSALDAASYRRIDGVELEKRAVLRLLQEGFAVVAPGGNPDVLVRVRLAHESLVLEAGEASRTVPLRAGKELQVEVAQKISDLAREAAAALRPVEQPDAGVAAPPLVAPIAPVVDAGVPAPPEPAVAPSSLELSAGAGALVRGPVDPLIELSARVPLSGAAALRVEAGASWSSGPGIEVAEPQLLAGIGYAVRPAPSLRLEAALVAGAALHFYSLGDLTAFDPSGTRLDALVETPLTLTWTPWRGLTLGLRVAPGTSTRARDHLRNAVKIWSRSALRLEAGADVGWNF